MMKVEMIGFTVMDWTIAKRATGGVWEPSLGERAIDCMPEFAGRACYQSWSKPNPKTAANKDYLNHILEVGHFSVLSHASATFYVTGISRSLTHELIRHRWLAFSELSQRYVEPGHLDVVRPPEMSDEEWDVACSLSNEADEYYDGLITRMTERGITGKRARQMARAVLPNMTETRIVVSGNMRAWRDFLDQRATPQADAEIRQLAMELYDHLVGLAPNTFQDYRPGEVDGVRFLAKSQVQNYPGSTVSGAE